SQAVAASVAKQAFGESAEVALSVLVMISALGAINGLIFTGSRVYAALGSEHTVFAFLGQWNPRFGAPLWSLSAQAIITIGMIFSTGTFLGRQTFDRAVHFAGLGSQPFYQFNDDHFKGLEHHQANREKVIGQQYYSDAELTAAFESAFGPAGDEQAQKERAALLETGWTGPIPWAKYFGGFATLVAGTAPVFWGFFLLSGLSLFALRQRDPDIHRPFRVPFYPIIPLIFCSTCFYMLYQSLSYASTLALMGGIPLLLGIPLFYLSRERAEESSTPPAPEPSEHRSNEGPEQAPPGD
ncbi:MAG: amino acid permease, partial [Gemmataceae bacterium]